MNELILYQQRRPEAGINPGRALNWALGAAIARWREDDTIIPLRSGRRLRAADIASEVTDALAARHLGFYIADYANRLFTVSLINRSPNSPTTEAVAGEFSPCACLLPKINGQPLPLLQQAFRALSITCDTLLELEYRGENLRPIFPPLPPGRWVHNFSQFRL